MGLFGSRGSGKSALMAYLGYQAINRDRKVFYYPEGYNFSYSKGDNKPVAMSPAQLVKIPKELDNSTVLIDEIQELLSKYRTNTTASMMLMAFFRQVRKRGCNVFFTSNDPNNINSAVAGQTDFHVYLNMISDQRCFNAGYHLQGDISNECRDYLTATFYDTQNTWSKGKRNSLFSYITHISRMYKYYDTSAVADVTEVLGLTKSSVLDEKKQESIGMSWNQLDDEIEEVIGSLVSQGYKQIVPRQFVKVLAQQKNIPIDATTLGRRLTGMGLSKDRKASGYVYYLPPDMETYEKWINGVWAFED